MLGTIFKVFFKVMLALAAVFAATAVLQHLYDQKADYIEIYNNDDELGEGYY